MDDDEEQAAFEKLHKALGFIANKYNLSARWGVEGVDDVFAPHPFPGATEVSFDYHDFFCGKSGMATAPIRGPRYLDLWIAADACMTESGDRHHIFIEGFVTTDKPGVLHVETGS